MNRDIQIPEASDYVLRLELLGENNQAYQFEDDDVLYLVLSDVKNSITEELEIDISEFANPLSYVISREFLDDTFEADPVKYKVLLHKESLTLCLLSGNIYREK